jgi:RecA/RadA recombinase
MSDFFRTIVEELKDEDMSMAVDGQGSAEFTSFIDTGCYMLNAIISGSIYGGMPDNKVLVLAGESSTGKTYVAMGIVKHFLDHNPEAGVIYYDTESAVTKDMMLNRGIDTKRVIIGEPSTLQDFRTKALNFLAKYAEAPEKNRPPVLMVLDSLGMLSSTKEMTDTAEGKDTRDMTKAQLIRGLFRVLRLKLAKLHIPMIVTGHTYAAVGAYVPMQVLSGGGGLQYASDSIVFLSKSKDKDGKDVIGNILTGKMFKSRLSRENKAAQMRLSYDTGLDRYFGLLEMAEEAELVKRIGNRYEFPNGEKYFRKAIDEDPSSIWTKDLLELLDEKIKAKFQYGSGEKVSPDPDLVD